MHISEIVYISIEIEKNDAIRDNVVIAMGTL